MSNLRSGFKSWLQNRRHHPNTVRNYLSDVNKFLASNQELSSYLDTITKQKNYPRYLSSLNKFFKFQLDQKIIQQNPLKRLLRLRNHNRQPSANSLLEQYKTYLIKQRKNKLTIKNYLNDIKQYIEFCESQNS